MGAAATIVVADAGANDLASQTIASVLAQTAAELQIVVASAAAAPESSLRALGGERARLELLHHPGVTLGRLLALGLERSRGLYVKFVFSGDMLVPECVERQLATLALYPQPSATLCRVAGEWPAGRCATGASSAFTAAWLDGLACTAGNVLRELLRGVPPPLAAALFSRAALQAAGGFDPTFVARPDVDLWFRLLPSVSLRGGEDALLASCSNRGSAGAEDVSSAEMGRALVAAFLRSGSDVLLRALGDGRWVDPAAERLDVARRLLACGAAEGRPLAHRLVAEALALGASWPDDDERLATLRWLVPEVRRTGIPAALRSGGAPRPDEEHQADARAGSRNATTFPPRLRLALWWEDLEATGAASLLEHAEALACGGIDLVCIAREDDALLDACIDRGVGVEVVYWPDSRTEIVAVLDRCGADALLVASSRPAAEIARAAGCIVLSSLPAGADGPSGTPQVERILGAVAAGANAQRWMLADADADVRRAEVVAQAGADAYRIAADGLRDPASCTGRARARDWNAAQSGDLIEIAREASALAVLGTELRARAERILGKLRLASRAESGMRVLRGLFRNAGKPGERQLEPGAVARFAAAATAEPRAWLWVVYATDPYSETRGQRSTWLAQELARRGHHVVYLYWRWSPSDPVAPSGDARVLSVPIDQLPDVQADLLAVSTPHLEKVFLAEFPDVTLFERLNLFAAHGFVTVYDCIDEWEEFARVGQAHWYDAAVERHLARDADVVVATHPLLAEKLSAMGDRPVPLIPNGVKLESLRPPTTARGPGAVPVLGYFGHLTSSWFDWELIVETAERHPQWRFEIIGYGSPADLTLPANVALLGQVAHAELSERTAHWCVGIVPFRAGALTRAVDPVKLYEYLALGMPVVAVDMPHLATVPGVAVCERSGFAAAVEECLTRPLERKRIAEFVAASTWQRRVDVLLELVADADRTRNVVRALAG